MLKEMKVVTYILHTKDETYIHTYIHTCPQSQSYDHLYISNPLALIVCLNAYVSLFMHHISRSIHASFNLFILKTYVKSIHGSKNLFVQYTHQSTNAFFYIIC